MRMFFVTVGVLAWVFALAVLWIFAESGGALAVIAAGVFAGLAIISLGLDRVLKMLEDIRDQRLPAIDARATYAREDAVIERKPTGPIPA